MTSPQGARGERRSRDERARRHETERGARARPRPDRAARGRRRDPVRASAEHRPGGLAAHRAGCARRSRPRGPARPPARQRDVRQRAEDRAGADDDVVHRGHAAARAWCRRAARSSSGPSLPAPIWAGFSRSRPPSRSSSSRVSGSPTGRRWRSRRSTCAQSLIPGLTAGDLEQRSFYELLEERYGVVIVLGHADDRADGDERGGVGRARRAAPLAGVPVRADDTDPQPARSSSTSDRSIVAIATGS